jgi:RNA recognition motif-containing protein
MSNKLYVGNLSYNTTDHDVEELFAQYGEVTSATVIVDRNTNQSKGFGFVEMADGAAAESGDQRP